MDPERFDALTRRLNSRRTALAGLAAACAQGRLSRRESNAAGR